MFAFVIFAICINTQAKANTGFSHRLDLQTRFDDRSSRDVRYQYRVRYYPQYTFDENWSVNAFAVTGDEFGSSHNTIDDGSADYFYFRRLFVRHETQEGKTELGVIPTFKGRVSSSGLSKDGWISGLRHVLNSNKGQLELVLGELNSLDPSGALSLPEKLDYVELEYSADLDELWSYELSLERIINLNYFRSELRFEWLTNSTLFAELVSRVDSFEIKTVLGVEGDFLINRYPLEYFIYYSFVDDDFGEREELTEDFLGRGHGFSGEIGGQMHFKIAGNPLDWFIRYDAVEQRTRFLAGIKWSWK